MTQPRESDSQRKSTTAEVVWSWLLTLGTIVASLIYVSTGNRAWVAGVVIGLIMLIAVVAGVAER